MSIRHYVLIDPFNTLTSGVSTYVDEVRAQITHQFTECTVTVIARQPEENIDAFRKRVSKQVMDLPQDGLLVEAPESLAATRDLPDNVPLHIRLHGSREFGRWLQCQRVDVAAVKAEQREIERARFLSAPSMAALESSKILSKISRDVSLYPNPIPQLVSSTDKNSSSRDFDILFLGRWQQLKGIGYLENLIDSLADYTFAVASSAPPAELPKRATFLPIRSPADRHNCIKRSRLVIIPSLFETASMVGLEALAVGRVVVTWDHIGLVEYTGEPYLFGAIPGSLPSLCEKVNRALLHTNSADDDFLNPCAGIHKAFKAALEDLIHNEQQIYDRMPLRSRIQDWVGTLNGMRINEMNSGRSIVVKRKFRKLMRDPVRFVLDSSFLRIFRKKEALVPAEPPEALPLRDVTAPAPISLANPLTAKLDDSERASSLTAELQSFAVLPDNLPVSSPLTQYTLGHLRSSGKISLKDPPLKPSSWTTVLIHSPEDQERILDLRARLVANKDFAPFRDEALTHIEVSAEKTEPTLSVLNRIDLKNKERVSSLANLVFIDVPFNIVAALRSCSPNSRTIVIVTDRASEEFEVAQDCTDALISMRNSDFEADGWRRANKIDSFEDLAPMLRKVVQEIGPKQPDMLIPLIGSLSYNPGLMDFDSRQFQGVIKLARPVSVNCENFHNYIVAFSREISEMMVLDSVYMRYRSLCEAIENGDSPAELIEFCLLDGVLFDVRDAT